MIYAIARYAHQQALMISFVRPHTHARTSTHIMQVLAVQCVHDGLHLEVPVMHYICQLGHFQSTMMGQQQLLSVPM